MINDSHEIQDDLIPQALPEKPPVSTPRRKYNSLTDPNPVFEEAFLKCKNDLERKIIQEASSVAMQALQRAAIESNKAMDFEEIKLQAFHKYLTSKNLRLTEDNALISSMPPFTSYNPLDDLRLPDIDVVSHLVGERLVQLNVKTLSTLMKRIFRETDRESSFHPMSIRASVFSDRKDDIKVYVDAFVYMFLEKLTSLCNVNIKENLVSHFIEFHMKFIHDIETCKLDKYTASRFAQFLEKEVEVTNSEISDLYVKLVNKLEKSKIKFKVPKDFSKFNPATNKYLSDLSKSRDEDVIKIESRLKYLQILNDR